MAKRKRGAQPGNASATRHHYYASPLKKLETIEDVITDAQLRQAQLSAIIDHAMKHPNEHDLDGLTKLFALHGQNASRLGRLLRDRRALTGEAADGIAGAISAALDELATELGVEL